MTDASIDLNATPNKLLVGLSREDKVLLRPLLRRCDLPCRKVLERRGEVVNAVHFLESGIVSILARAPLDRQVEVGIIGREGMTGLARVLGADSSPNLSFVHVAGTSLCLDSTALTNAMAASVTLRNRFDLFVQSFLVQSSQTTLANSKANVEQRLARWLVMVRDRVDGDDLTLTHEFLAILLGVRRAGVTVALHNLEGERLIHSKRGLIIVRDLYALRKFAGGIYGIAEAEYERLLGCSLS